MKTFTGPFTISKFLVVISAMIVLGSQSVSVASANWGYIDENQHKTLYPDDAFIDRTGKLVAKCPYRASGSAFSDGFSLLQCDENKQAPNERYTFMNRTGRVCMPGFEMASSFSEGLAAAGRYGKMGFIDKSGKFAISPHFEDVGSFREGLAPVLINNKFGFIDKSGKIVIDAFYDCVAEFSEGLAAAESEGKIGFIDKKGNWRIKPKYHYVNGFSNGIALVQNEATESYINTDGKILIQLDREHNKRAFVYEGISYTGFQASHDPFFRPGFSTHISRSNAIFSEELAAMSLDGKYGYMDKSGQFAIQPKFDCAYPFSEHLAKVKVGDKFGFIDKSGKIVIEPKYSEAGSFQEGVAAVAISRGKWGYIDTTGKYLIEPKYPFAWIFSEGLAQVQLWGSPP